MAARSAPFPWVLIGLCVLAVAWQWGHLWWGVWLLVIPVLLLAAPTLLAITALALLMLLAAVAYVPVLVVRLYHPRTHETP